MKTLKVYIDYPFPVGEQDRILEVELEGNETEKEIEEIAKETFQNEVNYGYEVKDDES